MNRKEFFKKLGIGVVAVVVAPKVIAEINIPSNYTEGIIPYMRRTEGLYPYILKQGNPKYYGVIVKKSRRSGQVYANSILMRMQKPMENIQMDWFRLQVALNKARKSKLIINI